MKAKDLKISYNREMQPVISLTLISRSEVENLQTLADLDKPLSVSVKVHREKRSRDANALYWALVTQLCEYMGKSQEELHIDLLRHYGHFEYIIVLTEALPIIKQCFKFTEEQGTKVEQGKEMTKLKCYPSSTVYNSKQFSVLLQGVIDECKEFGIETVPSEEFKRLIDNYERKEK